MKPIERMFELLEQHKYTATELSKYLDITTSTVGSWKIRKSPIPDKYILPICEFLEISPEYLLTGDTTKKVFDKPRVLDDLEEKFLNEFSSLTDLQKGIILGRIEAFNAPQQQKSP